MNTTPSLLGRLLANRPVDELRVLRSELASDLNATRAAYTRLQTELEAVDDALTARAAEANGSGQDTSHRTIPLRRAILTLLRERPGRWDREDLLDELQARGWAPGGRNPRNTVSSRLAEMAREGLIQRVGRGFALTMGGGALSASSEEEVPIA